MCAEFKNDVKRDYSTLVYRQTQWDPPNLDTGEHADDMDLGTPTLDDTTKVNTTTLRFIIQRALSSDMWPVPTIGSVIGYSVCRQR